VIQLDAAGKDYLPILTGPPQSVAMESGLVVLAPNQSVGKHSTKAHEELLIVLDGEGEMLFANGSKLPVKANSAVYCPPQTEHDVKNTGTTTLRYVYVVADAK
jgi:mannose-6-phosphate isomerase-like protein (cupin superfamily)